MKRATRNVLVSAVLAIALCISVIAGATFALFTSKSSVNIAITSGNVEVTATATELKVYSPKAVSEDGIVDATDASDGESTFANGGTATLDGNTVTLKNMTPGDKATFKITVKNESTVAVKYRTVIEAEDDGLFAALKVDIGGKAAVGATEWKKLEANEEIADAEKVCSIELPVDTNGDYKGKKCTLTFSVEATQGNAETVNEVIVTPETLATTQFKSDTTYVFAAGEYGEHGEPANQLVFYELQNITLIGKGAKFKSLSINSVDYVDPDHDNPVNNDKSTLTVKGFEVEDTLMIVAADKNVVIDNNTAGQITLKTNVSATELTIKNNKLNGGLEYGIYVVPNVTDYNLTITGNTFENVKSHAIHVQGGGDGSAVTAAKTVTVSGNTFNSYGANGKSGRAAFKIWADTKLAPNDTDPMNDAAKALAASILADNTFGSLGENCVVADFYGKSVAFN